jgi:hypothetical protein
MSAFGGEADIEKERGGYKKPGAWPGFRFPDSGGVIAEKISLYAEPFPLVA